MIPTPMRLFVLASLALPVLAITGCVSVRPWQRARLADPCMTFDTDGSLVAYETHWQESREGSSGGFGVQAGGCGCK